MIDTMEEIGINAGWTITWDMIDGTRNLRGNDKYLQNLSKEKKFTYISPLEAMCTDSYCKAIVEHKTAYPIQYDNAHTLHQRVRSGLLERLRIRFQNEERGFAPLILYDTDPTCTVRRYRANPTRKAGICVVTVIPSNCSCVSDIRKNSKPFNRPRNP